MSFVFFNAPKRICKFTLVQDTITPIITVVLYQLHRSGYPHKLKGATEDWRLGGDRGWDKNIIIIHMPSGPFRQKWVYFFYFFVPFYNKLTHKYLHTHTHTHVSFFFCVIKIRSLSPKAFYINITFFSSPHATAHPTRTDHCLFGTWPDGISYYNVCAIIIRLVRVWSTISNFSRRTCIKPIKRLSNNISWTIYDRIGRRHK